MLRFDRGDETRPAARWTTLIRLQFCNNWLRLARRPEGSRWLIPEEVRTPHKSHNSQWSHSTAESKTSTFAGVDMLRGSRFTVHGSLGNGWDLWDS